MPPADAERWDARYRNDARFAENPDPREFLRACEPFLPVSGLALDAAMGLGGNAGYLSQRGLQVLGIDISAVAVRRAKKRYPEIWAVQADLNQFPLPEERFDLIVNFYYLQRSVWQQYPLALKPGGLLVIETLTQEMLQLQPDISPEYLLAPGELIQQFSDMQVLLHREGWIDEGRSHRRPVASLLAVKI